MEGGEGVSGGDNSVGEEPEQAVAGGEARRVAVERAARLAAVQGRGKSKVLMEAALRRGLAKGEEEKGGS